MNDQKGESEVGETEWHAYMKGNKERTKEREIAIMLSPHSPADILRTTLEKLTALESVTVTEMGGKVATGVPDRLPVAASNTRPAGKEGEIENKVALGNP